MPFLLPPLLVPSHAYLGGCLRAAGAESIQVGGVADHVHILVRLKAIHSVANVIRDVKKASSQWLHEEMQQRGFHWQDGYAAFTVAHSQLASVQRYVANQQEHHRVKTFTEEYREFLEAHQIEFDERYLL